MCIVAFFLCWLLFYLQYEKVEAKNAIENGYELSLNGEKIKDANKSDIEDLNVMGIHNIEINNKDREIYVTFSH